MEVAVGVEGVENLVVVLGVLMESRSHDPILP